MAKIPFLLINVFVVVQLASAQTKTAWSAANGGMGLGTTVPPDPTEHQLNMAIVGINGAKTEQAAVQAAITIYNPALDMGDNVKQALETRIRQLRTPPGWAHPIPPPLPFGFDVMNVIMSAYYGGPVTLPPLVVSPVRPAPLPTHRHMRGPPTTIRRGPPPGKWRSSRNRPNAWDIGRNWNAGSDGRGSSGTGGPWSARSGSRDSSGNPWSARSGARPSPGSGSPWNVGSGGTTSSGIDRPWNAGSDGRGSSGTGSSWSARSGSRASSGSGSPWTAGSRDRASSGSGSPWTTESSDMIGPGIGGTGTFGAGGTASSGNAGTNNYEGFWDTMIQQQTSARQTNPMQQASNPAQQASTADWTPLASSNPDWINPFQYDPSANPTLRK